jgi:hypothetical protein
MGSGGAGDECLYMHRVNRAAGDRMIKCTVYDLLPFNGRETLKYRAGHGNVGVVAFHTSFHLCVGNCRAQSINDVLFLHNLT